MNPAGEKEAVTIDWWSNQVIHQLELLIDRYTTPASPLFRVMSKLFWSPTQTQEIYLQALGEQLGETVTPRVIVASES